MMYQPVEKLQVWLGGLPMVIAALASFTVAPYGIAKVTGIWNKNENGGAPVSDPPSNGTTGGKGLQAIS